MTGACVAVTSKSGKIPGPVGELLSASLTRVGWRASTDGSPGALAVDGPAACEQKLIRNAPCLRQGVENRGGPRDICIGMAGAFCQ